MDKGIDLLIGYEQEYVINRVLFGVNVFPAGNLFYPVFNVSQKVVSKSCLLRIRVDMFSVFLVSSVHHHNFALRPNCLAGKIHTQNLVQTCLHEGFVGILWCLQKHRLKALFCFVLYL